jgi:hypothetical protein
MPSGNGNQKLQTVLTQFSDPLVTVTLTTSGALDPALPSIVVPASFFPRGKTLIRVEAVAMWRKTENTNAAVNKLSGDQYIQVQKAAGALTNAIKFVDDELKTAATADGPGDAVVGGIDVKATVDADGSTYNMQWTNALTDQDSLILHDVRTGLRFYLG